MDSVIKNVTLALGKEWASVYQVIPARAFYALQNRGKAERWIKFVI